MVLTSALTMCTTLSALAETTVGGSNSPVAQQHFVEGTHKTDKGDNAGAVSELTEAITIDPKFGKAYANRAAARFNIHDYKGAIADIDVALKFYPNMQYLVDLRGKSVHAMEAPEAANQQTNQQQMTRQRANQQLIQAMLGGDLADPSTLLLMQAQRKGLMNGGAARPVVNPFAQHPLVVGQQNLTPGVASANLTTPDDHSTSQMPSATASKTAKEYFDLGCEKNKKMDFNGAIPEFDQSIALNSNFGDAFANRGLARFHIKDYPGALKDFQEADRLIPNNQQLKNLIELARRAANQ